MSKASRNQENAKAGNGRKNANGNGNGRRKNGKQTQGGRWFRSVEVALWLMVVGAVLFRFVPSRPQGGSEDGAAPDFTVHTLNAGKVTLSDLRGKVVLVNFWATWCPPCRLEMPGFERVYNEYKDKGFTVVGLSADQAGPGVVNSFIQRNGITYPVGMATAEMQREYGGVDALPESFLLDKTGKVRKMVEGMFSEETLRSQVGRLLAEDQG